MHVSVLKLDYFVNLLLCKLKYEWKIWMKRDTQWKTQCSNFQTSVSKSFLILKTNSLLNDGARNFTKYVFFHVQIGGLVQNSQNHYAICVKKKDILLFKKLICLVIFWGKNILDNTIEFIIWMTKYIIEQIFSNDSSSEIKISEIVQCVEWV